MYIFLDVKILYLGTCHKKKKWVCMGKCLHTAMLTTALFTMVKKWTKPRVIRNNSWHKHMMKAKALLKIILQRLFYDLRKCHHMLS